MDLLTDDEKAAMERVVKWDSLRSGCSLQERYAVYREVIRAGDPLTQMNMAHQRDLRLLAALAVRVAPLLDAVGPVIEECRRVSHVAKLMGIRNDVSFALSFAVDKPVGGPLTLGHVRAVLAADRGTT